jgi:thioredoxin 1
MTGDYIMWYCVLYSFFDCGQFQFIDCQILDSKGKEKVSVMSSEPIHVTDAAFEKTVLHSPIPVIVDFWAPWCNPCKMVAPILDKLATEYQGKILVAKVNTDENPEWMTKYGIQGIPTMLFVANGKIVHRQVGALPERMLRDVVTQFMEVVSQP